MSVTKDTIVLIGKVTARRTQVLRRQVFEGCDKVVAVRIPNDYFPVVYDEDFMQNVSDYEAVARANGSHLAPSEMDFKTPFNLVATHIMEDYPDLDFSRIACVIVSKNNHLAWTEEEYCMVFFGHTESGGFVFTV